MTNLLYSQIKTNEQKHRFQGIAHVFLASILGFAILNEILKYFLRFYYFLGSYGMDSLTNSAICSIMSIK